MNERKKYKYKKSIFIVCRFWLASMLAVGNFSYAQTEFEFSAPVEILMADPETAGNSVASVIFEQAKKHHDGDGVAQDFLKARDLYLRAAQMGSNDAKVNLGYLYFMGEGVRQDYEKARNWYLSAAKSGNKDAQLNLAMIYHNGFGVPKDNTQARYWRTYEQTQSRKNKPVVTVSQTPTAVKQSVVPKSVKKQVKTSQPSTSETKQIIVIKPKMVVERLNESKPKVVVKPDITEEPIMPIVKVAQNIPNAQMTIPQVTENNIGMGSINSVSNKEAVVSVPQAKSGMTGISETITALNKENILPAPIRTLRNRTSLKDRTPHDLSQWISNIIAVVMLTLVIITSVWFTIQYSAIGKQKKAQVFARAFYVHHRDRLRINYLHYPEKHRKIEEIDDSWAAVLCVLMVKFAQSQKDEETLVGMQSNKIIQALNESPLKAKLAVFPFVKITQRRIFDDIEAHECRFNGETESVGDTQAAKLMPISENELSTEVKLQSDSGDKQISILKENSSSSITE